MRRLIYSRIFLPSAGASAGAAGVSSAAGAAADIRG